MKDCVIMGDPINRLFFQMYALNTDAIFLPFESEGKARGEIISILTPPKMRPIYYRRSTYEQP
jgi:hypothetical protein